MGFDPTQMEVSKFGVLQVDICCCWSLLEALGQMDAADHKDAVEMKLAVIHHAM